MRGACWASSKSAAVALLLPTALYAFSWQALLRASATATPMTHEFGGRQYVVIASGGNPRARTKHSDAIIVFALPHR